VTSECVGVKSLIDLPLTAQVIGFMPNNGGHWHFVTFRITHFCYLLDRINWIFGIICLYFQFPDEIENIKSLRERGRTLKIEHLLYADCWTIDAGFRELTLFPKRQGVSSWKSPIDILPDGINIFAESSCIEKFHGLAHQFRKDF